MEEKYQSPIAAFRASKLTERHKGSTAAWFREGERQATDITCTCFNKDKFISILQEIRKLTQEEKKSVFIPKLVRICADVGIALSVVKAPKGCPVNGATRWLSADKALIILSDRYKTNDQFWFSFFHEAGHLHLHGKRLLFIDIEGQFDNTQEEEANDFARKTLIPDQFSKDLQKLKKNEKSIRNFAKEIGIAPGIVVGRMQKEKLLPWNHLNRLKSRLD